MLFSRWCVIIPMLRSATVKVYTVCITERYECEVDSMSKLIEPHRMGLHKYDARCCIILMERYRSGHNGADSKSVCAQAHEGSNPSLSAKKKNHPIGWFFLFLNGGERGVRTQWTKQPSELFCERWPKFFAKRYINLNPKRWAKNKNESLTPSKKQ